MSKNILDERTQIITDIYYNKGSLITNNFYDQVRDKKDYWSGEILSYLNSLYNIEDEYGQAINVDFSPSLFFTRIKFEAEDGHRYCHFKTKKLINTVAVELDRKQRINYIYEQIFNIRAKLMKFGDWDILHGMMDITDEVQDINDLYIDIDAHDTVKKQNLDLRIYKAIIKVNRLIGEVRKKYSYIDTSNPKLENYQMKKRPIYHLASKK